MNTWNTGQAERQEVFDNFADSLKPFGNGRRLELVEILAQGEHSVETLARLSGLALTTTSNNLQNLKRTGLVKTRRDGTTIYYSLADDDVLELFLAAKKVALRHNPALANSLQAYMGNPRYSGPTIDPASVTEDMFIIDVRPHSEYASHHFPNAVSIPIAELEDRYSEIPQDRPIAIYCRGELCRLAREAATYLRGQGLDARAMDDGITEWRVAKDITLDHAS